MNAIGFIAVAVAFMVGLYIGRRGAEERFESAIDLAALEKGRRSGSATSYDELMKELGLPPDDE